MRRRKQAELSAGGSTQARDAAWPRSQGIERA
jgi:hypothetical protein